MKPARKIDMFEELKMMPPGSRLVEANGATFLLAPGETAGGADVEEWFVKEEDGSIVDCNTGEIVFPVEDE